MDLLGLVRAVWQESGSDGPEPVTVVGVRGELQRILGWVIRADLEIQSLYTDWGFLWRQQGFATVAGQRVYDAVPGASAYDQGTFFIDGDQGIIAVDYIDVKGEAPYTSPGRPFRAVIMPDLRIRFDPAPDDVHQITFDAFMAPIAMDPLDLSQSVIPEPFRYAIVGKALMHYGKYENAPEILQQGTEMYADWLFSMSSLRLPGKRSAHKTAEGNDLVITVE